MKTWSWFQGGISSLPGGQGSPGCNASMIWWYCFLTSQSSLKCKVSWWWSQLSLTKCFYAQHLTWLVTSTLDGDITINNQSEEADSEARKRGYACTHSCKRETQASLELCEQGSVTQRANKKLGLRVHWAQPAALLLADKASERWEGRMLMTRSSTTTRALQGLGAAQWTELWRSKP